MALNLKLQLVQRRTSKILMLRSRFPTRCNLSFKTYFKFLMKYFSTCWGRCCFFCVAFLFCIVQPDRRSETCIARALRKQPFGKFPESRCLPTFYQNFGNCGPFSIVSAPIFAIICSICSIRFCWDIENHIAEFSNIWKHSVKCSRCLNIFARMPPKSEFLIAILLKPWLWSCAQVRKSCRNWKYRNMNIWSQESVSIKPRTSSTLANIGRFANIWQDLATWHCAKHFRYKAIIDTGLEREGRCRAELATPAVPAGFERSVKIKSLESTKINQN